MPEDNARIGNVTNNDAGFTCDICASCYTTKSGLGVHRRRKHPEAVHAEGARKLSTRKKVLWTDEERLVLSRFEFEAEEQGTPRSKMNRVLAAKLGGRSMVAIRKARQSEAYTAIRAEQRGRLRAYASASEPEAEDSDTGADDVFPRDNPLIARYHEYVNWFDKLNSEDDRVLKIQAAIAGNSPREFFDLYNAWTKSMQEPERRPLYKNQPRRPGDTTAKSKRRKRRESFTALQKTWNLSRSRAATQAIEGTWGDKGGSKHSRGELATFWRKIFDVERVIDTRPEPLTPPRWGLADPISVGDCTDVLKGMSISSAGPDRISIDNLRKSNRKLTTAMLNGVLFFGKMPDNFRESRTTLIPKTKEPATPGDYRPISVSSMVCRLFHGIINRRVSREYPLHHTQRAFRSVDGVAVNLAVLDHVICKAKAAPRNAFIAFVDLRKAFDSVHHDSIIRQLKSRGVPPVLLDYLRDYYGQGTTTIGRYPMPMARGVRQGDPLSPLLFNMIVDQALEKVDRLGTGFDEGRARIQSLAFADDVVLIASTKQGLQEAVGSFLGEMELSGPVANPGKCATLVILADGKNKRHFVDPEACIRIGGELVPALSVVNSYKYLGVKVGAMTQSGTCGEELVSLLANLKKSPLKPAQKVYTVINHVVPRLQHRLVFGDISAEKLHRLDRMIRRFVRELLNFPGDTPLAYFYAKAADGGMGIPSLRTRIPRLALARLERLRDVDEPDIAMVTMTEKFELKCLGVRSRVVPLAGTAEGEREHWKEALYQKLDGRGLQSFPSAGDAQAWVNDGSQLKGRRYIGALQVRGNLIRTPVRNTRGGRTRGVVVDCQKSACTGGLLCLSHMVQSCGATYRRRIARHDRIALVIAKELEGIGYTVLREPRLPFGDTFRKPDLVCSKGGYCFCIDVAVCGDAKTEDVSLNLPYQAKVDKYSDPQLTAAMRALTNCHLLKVGAFIVTWRGVVCERSAELLEGMGVRKRLKKLLSVLAVEGSYDAWVAHRHSAQ